MHKLSGRWKSRVFNHDSGEIPIERDDGWFDLVIDDAGTVLGGSTHTRLTAGPNVVNVVTGRAVPPTGKMAPTGLILEEVLDVAGTTMTFSGFLLIDGITQKVLVGDAKKTTVHLKGKKTAAVVGQEEGTWVGTQP